MHLVPGKKTIGEDISLLYMDITWAERNRRKENMTGRKSKRENQTDRWREEGKHLVLRFVCDIPGEEKHMDIPQWLYDKLIMREPGMIWSMERDMLLIIIMNR